MRNKNFTLSFVIMLIASTIAIAQVDPGTENLTHAWTFDDGTAIDTVGSLEGVLMGDAAILNGSLQTTMPDSWMELPANDIGINNYTEVSVEAWFKSVPNGNTGFHMLVAFGNTTGTIGVDYFFITPARGDDISRAAISCGDPSTPWASETGVNGTEYDDGNIHHMVSTIDADSIALYIDGELQTITLLDTNNRISALSTTYAYLAKGVYTADPTWRGEILEFNMYNKALSAEEILFLFNESNVNPGQRPVIVEAESGELGNFFSTLQDGDVSYITTTTNYSGTGNPGDSNRVATYEVTFKDSGFYSLYMRLRVGPGAFDDDSYFYARGFGEKNDTASADWVFNNGLAAAGFSDSADIVNEVGSLGTGVWKWVNATKNTYSGAIGDTFYVSLDSLTKTFQFASREDGLDFDKIAFGKSNLFYTVQNLDNGEPGFTEIPEVDTTYPWEGPPLASNQPKFVGNIYSAAQIENFESYWNQVVPENEGKWGSVEGTRDNMNWTGLDAAYNLAKDNDFSYMFHVLVWGAQQPAWIDTLQSADQLAEIREWFQAVADRYPDIDYLQVANEILLGHNPPDGTNGRANYKEALGGNGETGWDWVVNAFRIAREIFPQGTKLMINDYNIINSNSNTAQYLHLIRLLQSENLIDAIGEQAHAGQTDAPVVTMKSNLDSLASTGLPIFITEFDVRGPTDAIQLQDYQRLFPLFYEHPGVKGITLWGWRAPLYIENAYLINNDGSERPALVWLRDYLDTVDVTVGVNDIAESPNEFRLDNNYPNPFNPTTNIQYSIATTSKVALKVYDVLGKEVQILVDEVKSPGQYTVTFNAQNLASGIYFYQINAGSFTATKKLMLLK